MAAGRAPDRRAPGRAGMVQRDRDNADPAEGLRENPVRKRGTIPHRHVSTEKIQASLESSGATADDLARAAALAAGVESGDIIPLDRDATAKFIAAYLRGRRFANNRRSQDDPPGLSEPRRSLESGQRPAKSLPANGAAIQGRQRRRRRRFWRRRRQRATRPDSSSDLIVEATGENPVSDDDDGVEAAVGKAFAKPVRTMLAALKRAR